MPYNDWHWYTPALSTFELNFDGDRAGRVFWSSVQDSTFRSSCRSEEPMKFALWISGMIDHYCCSLESCIEESSGMKNLSASRTHRGQHIETAWYGRQRRSRPSRWTSHCLPTLVNETTGSFSCDKRFDRCPGLPMLHIYHQMISIDIMAWHLLEGFKRTLCSGCCIGYTHTEMVLMLAYSITGAQMVKKGY